MQKCGQKEINSIKLNNESHLPWKEHFHKNTLYFRLFLDFEADNENDNTHIGNKTNNLPKQNPLLHGYFVVSELNKVLKSSFFETSSGYDNVDWFVEEVIKLENKIPIFYENTNKDFIMAEEDEEHFRNKKICQNCQNEKLDDKIRDPCQLTGEYRGPVHGKYNITVTQKQSNFIAFLIHKCSNYDCQPFFQKLPD